jgi:hypothetical protein
VELLSVSDVVDVLRALGYALTPRQVRYVGLRPARRLLDPNGSRLFDAVDVGLLAVYADLCGRCRTWGLPLWTARAALRYREPELRRALAPRQRRYLVMDATTGRVHLSDTRDVPGAIDLQLLMDRVTAAVEALRAQFPETWAGSRYLEKDELAEVFAV